VSLEGNQGDRFTGDPSNRRLRPITREYALLNVPRIVLLMKRRQLSISRGQSREVLPVFLLFRDRHPEDRWTLLEEDFLRVKQVASQVDVRLFPSESVQSVLARIRAVVQVEWPP